MMARGEVDGEGAARRQRQRRLRSWLKHERQSVAMALAGKTHHASRGQTRARAGEGVEHEKFVGLRAQKPPLPRKRPAPLVEVAEPQGGAGTVGFMPASVPRLALHRLQGDDGVDGTAHGYLLKHAIEMRKVLEEEERRKEEEKEKEKAARSSASSAPKRTRKKRRKKKAPRGVRIRRCGQGFCSRSSLSSARMMPFTLSSLLGAGPRCAASWLICSRRTVARSSSFLAVACARLVLLVIMLLVLCSLLLLPGPRCSTSWPVWTRRTVTWCFPVLTQMQFPMVQTVLRFLLLPQLQFVARWSMSSSCWYCRFHRCISWSKVVWTCPLCATPGAGRDCAQNCGGLRSCSPSASWSDVYGDFGRSLHIFSVMVNSGPEVDCHSGNMFSTSPLYLAVIRVHASVSMAYGRISFIQRDGLLDWRSILVLPGVVRTRKSGHYPYELPVDV